MRPSKRLRQIWQLAEEHGAVLVNEYNDAGTVEREYKFPSKDAERRFHAEASRKGLL